MDHKDLCEHTRIRLIAAAVGHQQCTKTAGTEVQIPGTDKRILIGNDAYLAKVAAPATVFQNDGREPDWAGYAAAEAAHAQQEAAPALTKEQIEDIIQAIKTSMNIGSGFFFPRGWNVLLDKLNAMRAAPPPASQPVAPEAAQVDVYSLRELLRELADAADVVLRGGVAGLHPAIEKARAYLVASPAPVAAHGSWKLVPIEPTRAMMEAGFDTPGAHMYGASYRAMVAAAPVAAVAPSDAKDATVPDHSERGAANAGGQDTVAWLIEWRTEFGGERRMVTLHDLLAEVRAEHNNATVTELVPKSPATIAAGKEGGAS